MIWIRTPTPATHGSASPDKKPKRCATGYAACRGGPPVRGCIRELLRSRRNQFHECRRSRFRRGSRSRFHATFQMVPFHAQFSRGPVDAFRPGRLDSQRPQFVRYRCLSLPVLSPCFKPDFGFLQCDDRRFASRHGLPPRRIPRRQIDLTSYCRCSSCRLAERTRSSFAWISLHALSSYPTNDLTNPVNVSRSKSLYFSKTSRQYCGSAVCASLFGGSEIEGRTHPR